MKCGSSGPTDFEREINSRGVARQKVVIFWLTVLEVIYFKFNLIGVVNVIDFNI